MYFSVDWYYCSPFSIKNLYFDNVIVFQLLRKIIQLYLLSGFIIRKISNVSKFENPVYCTFHLDKRKLIRCCIRFLYYVFVHNIKIPVNTIRENRIFYISRQHYNVVIVLSTKVNSILLASESPYLYGQVDENRASKECA